MPSLPVPHFNQIGAVTETLEAWPSAAARGTAVRLPPLGETEDHFIADLATGAGCGHLKSGAPAAASASPSTTGCWRSPRPARDALRHALTGAAGKKHHCPFWYQGHFPGGRWCC